MWDVEVKPIDTSMGKDLQNMIDKGMELQFNGIYEGNINEETGEVENLKFITIDVVPV